uniref:Hydrolase_4 domain-containing protein n=1 Tax=Strongyloides venezuelensis TaxID=75913 RepID=A0A0K0F5N6_STRVS
MTISNFVHSLSRYILVPLALYISLPIIFKCSGKYAQKFIYLTQIHNVSNLKNPKQNGVIGRAENLYIKDKNGNRIGIYYIQAHSDSTLIKNNTSYITGTKIFKSDRPFVIYFHGSKGTRACGERINLYNILSQELDYNVIALDYSGFGDSEGEADIKNIINSSTALVDFVETTLKCNFIAWGHSLGGGILLETLADISSKYKYLLGVILESTFTSLNDSLYHHPYTLLYNWNTKIMETFIIRTLNKHGVVFNNKNNISKINVPILILHSVDDNKIPIHLGEQLYEEAIKKGKTIDMIVYEGNEKLGHSGIYRANSFKNDINNYINKCFFHNGKALNMTELLYNENENINMY